MRLVTKVFLVLAAVVALSVALNYAVLKSTVMPAFAKLERETAEQNMQRVIDAIHSDLRNMLSTAIDWAHYNDSYNFILDEPAGYRADFVDGHLPDDTLTALNLNAMLFLDDAGKVVWSKIVDLETAALIQVDELPQDAFPASSSLLDRSESDAPVTGILRTGRAPMLVVSAPILRSDRTGPAAGTIIIGRFLDDAMVEELRGQTHVAFDVLPLEHQHHDFDASELESMGGFGAEGEYRFEVDGDQTHILGVVRDIVDIPIKILNVHTPREIFAIGERTTWYALLSLLAVGLLVMAVIGLLLKRVVLTPIGELTENVLDIKRTGDLSRRRSIHRNDEIGILSAEFDRMLGQLDSARQELVDQSYKAGIAEMAAGILHNIRNQLSPLTMRIGRLRKSLSAPTDCKIDRAFEELTEDKALGKRSAKLVQYLRLSVAEAARVDQKALADIDAMARQLSRVDDVLGEQDRFSRAKRVVEQVSLPDVVARAISLVPDAENSGIEIEVGPGVEALGAFHGDRFVLTQIINNLLINSAEAIKTSGVGDGRIDIVASTRRSSDGGEEIVIEIRDNGVGIAADIMPRIFERGFTTKDGGKGGFGLHWCANTAATVGGRIHAASQGHGKGATMELVLPTKSALDSAA